MAIKKVRLTLEPTGTAVQLAALAATEDDWHWPPAWSALRGAMEEAMAQLAEETEEIRALCEELAGAEGVYAALDADDEVDEATFVCGAMAVDLREVLDAEDGGEVAATFIRLLDVTWRSAAYHADMVVGGKRMDLDDALRTLTLELAARGVPVEGEEVPSVQFEGEGRRSATASASPAPPPPPPRATGKRTRNTESRGGFGGLDGEEAVRHQPRGRVEPLVDGFTHEEHFFIYQTRITWPIPGEHLELLRKRVLADSHPDRFAAAGDEARRAAHERFVWLSTGAERLLARLAGRGG